ncbi:MAG: ATP-binding protein [Xanthomonadales bacterium]|nr:ATP-binding protein [Xanthomonadales bacterium]
MDHRIDHSFLALLARLRWVTVTAQVLTIALVTGPLAVPLDTTPLWPAVALLATFAAFASWRLRHGRQRPREAVWHLAVDIIVLSWLIAWSGGLTNPFGSLFLLPIALAALALPNRQVIAVAVLALVGYAVSAWIGKPLPYPHHDTGLFDLHLTGMAVNFLVTAAVLMAFFARMRQIQREQEQEISQLRERFTRNEGILALATHAASVAHELNTPLATLTLLLDERIDNDPGAADEGLRTMRQLLDVCRDRVRSLSASADPASHQPVPLASVIAGWRLLRPGVELAVQRLPEPRLAVAPGVAHLLRALLDNAAEASARRDSDKVELALWLDGGLLWGRIRDHGPGFAPERAFLPGLFESQRPDGLGLGLTLSHATVEQLGGRLRLLANEPGSAGACVELCLPAPAFGKLPDSAATG